MDILIIALVVIVFLVLWGYLAAFVLRGYRQSRGVESLLWLVLLFITFSFIFSNSNNNNSSSNNSRMDDGGCNNDDYYDSCNDYDWNDDD